MKLNALAAVVFAACATPTTVQLELNGEETDGYRVVVLPPDAECELRFDENGPRFSGMPILDVSFERGSSAPLGELAPGSYMLQVLGITDCQIRSVGCSDVRLPNEPARVDLERFVGPTCPTESCRGFECSAITDSPVHCGESAECGALGSCVAGICNALPWVLDTRMLEVAESVHDLDVLVDLDVVHGIVTTTNSDMREVERFMWSIDDLATLQQETLSRANQVDAALHHDGFLDQVLLAVRNDPANTVSLYRVESDGRTLIDSIVGVEGEGVGFSGGFPHESSPVLKLLLPTSAGVRAVVPLSSIQSDSMVPPIGLHPSDGNLVLVHAADGWWQWDTREDGVVSYIDLQKPAALRYVGGGIYRVYSTGRERIEVRESRCARDGGAICVHDINFQVIPSLRDVSILEAPERSPLLVLANETELRVEVLTPDLRRMQSIRLPGFGRTHRLAASYRDGVLAVLGHTENGIMLSRMRFSR